MNPARIPVLTLNWLALLASLIWTADGLAQDPSKIDFSRDIKPILSNNCFFCHGPDANERKGGKDGLRLDTEEGAFADQGGTFAVVKGQPDKSELVRRTSSTDPDVMMPPKTTGKKLSEREIALLKEWVKQGGNYARHWSYAKPVRPAVPSVKDTSWAKNDIDRFLLARLEREGLKPVPEADRYSIIRRVSLDLTGLPPTWAEVEAFVNDKDANAYEKVVDRLLKQPAYGEHWGHMWLDLARYADSAGYADDPSRVIWAFRDYVIKSLNANKPFDQFTIEQIAGDLLPEPTDDQIIATAFHRNTLTNSEGGTIDEEFRNVAIVDRVNTTMAVWMGTTMACAQCHTHKFDPISQEEYFRFFAFFNNTDDADRRDETPLLMRFTESQLLQKSQLEGEIASLDKKLATPTPELVVGQTKWEQSFPLDLQWQTTKPSSAASSGGNALTIGDDSTVLAATAKTAKYTIDIPLSAADKTSVNAVRLEALPDDALPGKGPGFAGGNFVVSKLTATVQPPEGSRLNGRFVRVEQLGKNAYLHLAEVQVFSGAENVARQGEAKQISTDYDGPPQLAIDGNTDGNYAVKSVSHTAQAENPWWEVDLKTDHPLDRIVVWNRTDAGTEARLNNWRVAVLNATRDVVWEFKSTDLIKPSRELSLSGVRDVKFIAALADFEQPMFEAKNVIEGKANSGWAVGGALSQPHTLTVISAAPVEAPAGSKLVVTIDQSSNLESHVLGKFRLSWTNDTRVAEFARTPAAVLAVLNTKPESRTDAQKQELAKHYVSIAPELKADRDRLAAVKKQFADLKPAMTVPIMKELAATQRRKTQLQHRGNYLDLGQEVTEGVPAAFPALPEGAPLNRLTLAKWLIDPNNPLTARVIANRFWEQVFGIGIVSTSEEFGSQGDQPFHPELLDWLATELVDRQWDMKSFVKLLVMSAAYRQSSKVTPELFERDPDNRLLARGPRFRLSAEMIRDQALALSGLLSPKMYGPSAKPPQPTGGLSAAFGSSTDWTTSAGEDKFRRGLYTEWRRSNPYPSMSTFDAPNREVCTVRRSRTNTPLQALVTLNDPVYVEAAQALARRIATSGPTARDKALFAFRQVTSRNPTDDELNRLVKLFDSSREQLQKQPARAQQLATEPLGPAPKDADIPELAAWTLVSNVLLNLDEMLMKR
ncbi:MAG: DUF1553 domain-containing protein [Planctomycetota bacterium]